MVLERVLIAMEVFKKIVDQHNSGKIIDAKSGYCTCVYAEGNMAVPVKLVPGVKSANENFERFQKAVINQLSLSISSF